MMLAREGDQITQVGQRHDGILPGVISGTIAASYRKTGIMAKILMVGCGDVGGRAALALAAAGHEVHGLRRSARGLPGVHVLQGDVTDPATLHLPAGLDQVCIVLSPDGGGEEAYRRVYLDGTRHVLAALSGQALQRVFLVSSTSVHAQDDGSRVDETSPAVPASATARILLDMEAAAAASGWPVTVVRFAGIYGPGRRRLLQWVESGRAVQAEPPLWTNRIHVEDCAQLLVFLCERALAGVPLAPLYIGTDMEPAPQHEVLDWLADRMRLPRLPRTAGAGANKRLDNARILALGYRFRFPGYRDGYAAMLEAADDVR
jgi:nucleoside-diphosphate-sugar epimerase